MSGAATGAAGTMLDPPGGVGGIGGPGFDRDARRALIRSILPPDPRARNGIDFVEVASNHSGAPDHVPGAPQQRTLLVYLLRGPVGGGLGADRVGVLGGVRPDPRLNPVRVEWAYPAIGLTGAPGHPAVDPLPGVSAPDRALVATTTTAVDRDRILVVRTSSSGDWSGYVLALLAADGQGFPDGFDEPLCREPFTFTVDCPNPLDCACRADCPTPPGTSPLLDYLARDYDRLRTRLLDRFAQVVPGWRDTNAADPAVTLLELFAYLGDRLTLWQDAVAAEAYLPTARRRPSVRRHARLLDYRMHEGCAARTWLAFTVPPGPAIELPAHQPVAALPTGAAAVTVVDALAAGGTVFETVQPATLRRARNSLALHAWGDVDACLPAGSTAAFVAHPTGQDPTLAGGDVVVLAPVDEDESTVSGDEQRRRAVRLVADPVRRADPLAAGLTVLEIRWAAADALGYPLPVARRRSDGTAGVAAVALANVVLAEHAGSVPAVAPDPPQVPDVGRYEPRLPTAGLIPGRAPGVTTGAPPGLAWVDEVVDTTSAASSLAVDPRRTRAQLQLDDGVRTWTTVPDLLGSGADDPHVVAEPEDWRHVRLRFGRHGTGRAPAVGDLFHAYPRLGGGSGGNVGPDVLRHVLATAVAPAPAGLLVTNPLPAVGGADPEALAAVREAAPHAFRSQLRAVTSADHAATAAEVGGVQRAVARRRWTGSWHVQEVTVDLVAGPADDPRHTQEASLWRSIGQRLEGRRMTGGDVELATPVAVALEIVVGICVASGFLRSDVCASVLRRMSAGLLPDGRRGFFHPDNFTFGQPLYVSDLVAAVMALPGVAWVDVGDDEGGPLRFRRLGRPGSRQIARGRIDAAPREVLCAQSDPSAPERGRFDLVVRGGS